jgi:hypothetical protein
MWNFYDASTNLFDRFIILDDGIHLVRELGQSNTVEVAYTQSSDFGMNWSPPFFLSTTDSLIADEPDIAGNEAGLLCAVWRDAKFGSIGGFGASIILRRSTDFGSTWLEEQLLTTQPVGLFPRLAVEDDFVVITWSDDQTGNMTFRFSSDGGETFMPEETLAAPGGDGVIAIKNSWIHTAWFAGATNGEIFYRRGQIISVAGLPGNTSLPEHFALHQNYPNPFNAETVIGFNLPKRSFVKITLFDILGKGKNPLVNGMMEAGAHRVRYDGSSLSSGVYLYLMEASGFHSVRKLVIVK